MPMLNKSFLLLFGACLLWVFPVRAENPAPAEHEAPAGEHGAPAGAAAPVQSVVAPWIPVENKIQELHSKIKSKEANIIKLLEEKNHMANGSAHLKTTVAEILKEHKELRSLAEDYQKNVSILKYRFPERNAKSGRSYDRIEVKSIDEMELAMGVDGKLNRNLKRMRSQFKPGDGVPAIHRSTASEVAPKPIKKEKSIEEADTVILHK